MKKTAKIVSALLVLVLMMAQIVCVNAATKANCSISAKQTDHFEKTITIKFTNASKVTKVYVGTNDHDDQRINTDEHNFVDVNTFSISLKVRPSSVKKVLVTYIEDGTEVKREFTVGSNGYYNIDSNSSSSSSNGIYNGLVSSGSSSSSSVTEYDPNAWHGYFGEKKSDVTTYFVTCRTLNVRSGAGTNYSKVGTLRRNEAVKVYDITNNWAVVEFGGHLRFVSAKYLSK